MNKLLSSTPKQRRAVVVALSTFFLMMATVVGARAWIEPVMAAPPHRDALTAGSLIQPGVATTGTITIAHKATPATGIDFTFNSDIPGHATFQLDDAEDDDGDSIGNTLTMSEILTGVYTVTQETLTGWPLKGILCDDDNSTAVLSQAKAEIVLGSGEAVSCTFENEQAGVIVEESDGETHVAEGVVAQPLLYASYDVHLASQPIANVRIDITTDDQVFITKTVLTFTAANWSAPQRVLILAANDDFEEADLHFGLVTHSVSSSDPDYNDVPAGYLPFEDNPDFIFVANHLQEPDLAFSRARLNDYTQIGEVRVRDEPRIAIWGRTPLPAPYVVYDSVQFTTPFDGVGPTFNEWPDPAQARIETPLGAEITLANAGVEPSTLADGETLHAYLTWRSEQEIARDYKLFVHIADPATGQPVVQWDGFPGLNTARTRDWAAGETFDDHALITIPAATPSGRYHVLVGLYDAESGERLGDQAILIGTIEINR